MMGEKITIWHRLQTIPREILYILMIISMIVPLLYPLGLPLPISSQTKSFYDSLNTLEEGDVMLQFVDWGAGSISIHQPGCVAVTYQAIEHFKLEELQIYTKSHSLQEHATMY
jgi:hypothetical protein